MSAFKGSYSYSIDNKGRISFPAKLRKSVSPDANDTFVVTRGFEKCVFIYPHDEWVKLEDSIRELSTTDANHRFFMHALLQHATDSTLDAQARISIPRELLQHAHLDGEVLIIGLLEHIEVWNPKEYQKYLAGRRQELRRSCANSVAAKGIAVR